MARAAGLRLCHGLNSPWLALGALLASPSPREKLLPFPTHPLWRALGQFGILGQPLQAGSRADGAGNAPCPEQGSRLSLKNPAQPRQEWDQTQLPQVGMELDLTAGSISAFCTKKKKEGNTHFLPGFVAQIALSGELKHKGEKKNRAGKMLFVFPHPFSPKWGIQLHAMLWRDEFHSPAPGIIKLFFPLYTLCLYWSINSVVAYAE